MALHVGQSIPLTVEKPAVGGRMIARAGGQVVLVGGAIPGERVTARVVRVGRGVAYAETIAADDPSPDRRPPHSDPLCGGCTYSHIAYPRQLELKARVIADAFARLGHLELPSTVRVAASPEDGYRMRARLHVRPGRIGFFREGTHEICDIRGTRQLLPATCDALDALAARQGPGAREVELSETVDASERVAWVSGASVAGAVGFTPGPYVTDVLTPGRGRSLKLRRHVLSFFQGNRYLIGMLAAAVAGFVPEEAGLIDLYAGTGLFAIAAALLKSARVTAVEGDRYTSADLDVNVASCGEAVTAVHQSVESFLRGLGNRPGRSDSSPAAPIVIVDPPRTGLSRDALEGLIALLPSRLIYVSCDVATLARDARRLVDAGKYALRQVEAFDLFPNTPHVETVVVLEREPVTGR